MNRADSSNRSVSRATCPIQSGGRRSWSRTSVLQPNDQVERRAVASPPNETVYPNYRLPPRLTEMLPPRSLEPLVRPRTATAVARRRPSLCPEKIRRPSDGLDLSTNENSRRFLLRWRRTPLHETFYTSSNDSYPHWQEDHPPRNALHRKDSQDPQQYVHRIPSPSVRPHCRRRLISAFGITTPRTSGERCSRTMKPNLAKNG